MGVPEKRSTQKVVWNPDKAEALEKTFRGKPF